MAPGAGQVIMLSVLQACLRIREYLLTRSKSQHLIISYPGFQGRFRKTAYFLARIESPTK